jgi:ribosomal protein S14
MEGLTKDSLMVRGRPIDRDKGKFSGRKYKSKGRSKSPVQSMRRCRKCGKPRYYKRDYKLKVIEFNSMFDEKHSIERKTTPDKGGDVYLASTNTQSDQDVWLIESRSSFHMTPHREWFYEYQRYEGGSVLLGDE